MPDKPLQRAAGGELTVGGTDVEGEPLASPPLPDPGAAGTLDELVERLHSLKMAAGNPSYGRIKERVNVAWTRAGRPDMDLAGKTTIVDCFRPGRRQLNADLVVAVVAGRFTAGPGSPGRVPGRGTAAFGR
jgi:hypothetical protein